MISYTLYFYNNSLLHGHENLRTLLFEVIDFDPEKVERKGGARFLAFSIVDNRNLMHITLLHSQAQRNIIIQIII